MSAWRRCEATSTAACWLARTSFDARALRAPPAASSPRALRGGPARGSQSRRHQSQARVTWWSCRQESHFRRRQRAASVERTREVRWSHRRSPRLAAPRPLPPRPCLRASTRASPRMKHLGRCGLQPRSRRPKACESGLGRQRMPPRGRPRCRRRCARRGRRPGRCPSRNAAGSTSQPRSYPAHPGGWQLPALGLLLRVASHRRSWRLVRQQQGCLRRQPHRSASRLPCPWPRHPRLQPPPPAWRPPPPAPRPSRRCRLSRQSLRTRRWSRPCPQPRRTCRTGCRWAGRLWRRRPPSRPRDRSSRRRPARRGAPPRR
mmetsp:Transcript_49159/g.153959  ORF Transcript_49159/g.153959 Transcript_49159/m.153959 type:complete len:317 (-) Transcript_49159:113-1063(-)